ncbi:MAG: hypothetical protein ACRED8_03820 [Caulobacteraceae bacterium]
MVERRTLLGGLVGVPLAAGAALADAAIAATPKALRAMSPAAETAVILLGHSAPGDGGGGLFVLAPGLARSAANGVTILADAEGQTWRRLFSGSIDVRWAGAKCDGISDDAAAIEAAARLGPVIVSSGECLVARHLTIGSACRIEGGAVIKVAAGVTATFAGGFSAPLAHVFAGEGTIAFDLAFAPVGHPEWWGAQGWLPSQAAPGPDCLAALEASVLACPQVELQPVDYWVSATWKINSAVAVRGVGVNAPGIGAAATRILVNDGVSDVVKVGPDAQPGGGVNAFLSRVKLSYLTLTRGQTVVPPSEWLGVGAGLNPATAGCSGLRVQFCEGCSFDNIWSIESTNGFYITGAVYCDFSKCFGSRVNAGTVATNDFYCGWLLDASPNIGLNAGIASLYLKEKCGANGGTKTGQATYGIYTVNAFTDMFIDGFETSSTQYGFTGNGSTSGTNYSSENLRMHSCVFDQVLTGITVSGGSTETNITIDNCYCASSLFAGSVGILIQNTPETPGPQGAISLIGNEVFACVTGISIQNSTGVMTSGNCLSECEVPIVLNGANNCALRDRITSKQTPATTAAIAITNSNRNVIDCGIDGSANAYPIGVDITDAASGYNEIRCSGIDPASIAGGSANKLKINGTQVTAAGASGTNLAQGIMN